MTSPGIERKPIGPRGWRPGNWPATKARPTASRKTLNAGVQPGLASLWPPAFARCCRTTPKHALEIGRGFVPNHRPENGDGAMAPVNRLAPVDITVTTAARTLAG